MDPTGTPVDPDCLGELTYQLGSVYWRAYVLKGVTSEGEPAYNLFIKGATGVVVPAGSFTHGAALVKYVREAAEVKFKGYTPVVDTIGALKDRPPASMAPACYRPMTMRTLEDGFVGTGRGLEACPKCYYRGRCGIPLGALLKTMEPPETEETFRARLRAKLKAIRKDES